MGKIKQGILGGFKGKVGTVIGSSWNGIAYMRGIPQSQKDPKTSAQLTQRSLFKEVQSLVSQLSAEQLAFLFPSSPKGMTRRNALVQQLTAVASAVGNEKHVDLACLTSLGNAPTADLPDVTIETAETEGSAVLLIGWDAESDWRNTHANEYPTVFVANVTKKKIFLVNASVTVGVSEERTFTVPLSAYGDDDDTFSGFMLSTGSQIALVGFGTLTVNERPARPPKKTS